MVGAEENDLDYVPGGTFMGVRTLLDTEVEIQFPSFITEPYNVNLKPRSCGVLPSSYPGDGETVGAPSLDSHT